MNLPLEVNLSSAGESYSANAQTRDLSYRGLYFILDRNVSPGTSIEFVLTLPKEITLAGELRVQCAGKVVRVEKANSSGRQGDQDGSVGVAAVIEQYEFLPPSS